MVELTVLVVTDRGFSRPVFQVVSIRYGEDVCEFFEDCYERIGK